MDVMPLNFQLANSIQNAGETVSLRRQLSVNEKGVDVRSLSWETSPSITEKIDIAGIRTTCHKVRMTLNKLAILEIK